MPVALPWAEALLAGNEEITRLVDFLVLVFLVCSIVSAPSTWGFGIRTPAIDRSSRRERSGAGTHRSFKNAREEGDAPLHHRTAGHGRLLAINGFARAGFLKPGEGKKRLILKRRRSAVYARLSKRLTALGHDFAPCRERVAQAQCRRIFRRLSSRRSGTGAKARLGDGNQQPWSAFLLHRALRDDGRSAERARHKRLDASLLGVTCHNTPRLVVSNANRDVSRGQSDPSRLGLDEPDVAAGATRPVREPAI